MNPRGQATTELALGALVFVVVLLFGIHFGEVPVLMLKVKEAANFSASHATGERTHLFSQAAILSGNTFKPFDPGKVGVDTRDRYADFDGMSDRVGAATFSAAVTQASGFRSVCARDNAVGFALSRSGAAGTKRASAGGQAFYDDTFNFLDARYKDRGGMSCEVSARVTAFRIPGSFVDSGAGGFAKEAMPTAGTFSICGAGRPAGGVCKGKLTVLTGDWAFDGPLAGADSNLNGDVKSFQDKLIANPGYMEFVRQLYFKNGDSQGGAGKRLLERGAGLFPGPAEYLDESLFNMSFQGVVGGSALAKVPRFVVDGPKLKYQTSGADLRSSYVGWTESGEVAAKIPTCFLGQRMRGSASCR